MKVKKASEIWLYQYIACCIYTVKCNDRKALTFYFFRSIISCDVIFNVCDQTHQTFISDINKTPF